MAEGVGVEMCASIKSVDGSVLEAIVDPEQVMRNSDFVKKLTIGPMLDESICSSDNECIYEKSRTQQVHSVFKDSSYRLDERLHYIMPTDLYDIFKSKSRDNSHVKIKLREMIPNLNSKPNYAELFHNLLYLEELEIMHAFMSYNDENVIFVANKKNMFTMRDEKIPELRPPISVGDFVHAWMDTKSTLYYRGKVHQLSENTITVKFNEDFIRRFNENNLYHVQFHYNRLIYKRKHIGVDDAVSKFLHDFLFPEEFIVCEPQLDVLEDANNTLTLNGTALSFHLKRLNVEQTEVVKQVLRGEFRPLPYIIYGPPGKTIQNKKVYPTFILCIREA